jgi:hypothetical protein
VEVIAGLESSQIITMKKKSSKQQDISYILPILSMLWIAGITQAAVGFLSVVTNRQLPLTRIIEFSKTMS